MDSTVRIEGVDYAPCQVRQAGDYWGIETPEKTFCVFPSCDEDGAEIKSLPLFLPVEIRAVTAETPDLTREHPETVREFFDKRRSYFSKATLQTYVSQYPNESCLTEHQFQTARAEILNEPMEKFTRSPLLREMVWNRHGTPQLADQYGYLGDVWDTEILPDGRERRFSQYASIALSLSFRLSTARNVSFEAAWAIVSGLKYVMIYKDVPERKFIYLKGMKAAPLNYAPQRAEIHIQAKIESHTCNEIRLHWPEGEALLNGINTTTRQTLAKVSFIEGKKQAKERKWHQDGGKASWKWCGHAHEAAELARHMRQVRDSWVRTNQTKRGATRKAIESGRAWWKRKFKGTALEKFLDESKISNSNLRRLMQRDFRENHKSKI